MVTGEKNVEIRKPSNWILQRLFNQGGLGTPRKYDFVKFVNGYGPNRPYFIAEFQGIKIMQNTHEVTFGNEIEPKLNFRVRVEPNDILIALGEIREWGNLTKANRKRIQAFCKARNMQPPQRLGLN
jgi:hypothetical protein